MSYVENIESKAQQIRKLHDTGMPIGEIAKSLDIRYQHAYNVISSYKKKQGAVNLTGSLGSGTVTTVRKGRKIGTSMFSRMNYQVMRGMMELVTLRDLSETDWITIKEFFDHRCAYCEVPDTGDARNGLVPDHLIPASQNGDYVIGNVIPACHSCNDRRGKKDWEMWLRTNFTTEAEKRTGRIKRYLQLYPHKHLADPLQRLTDEERVEFLEILDEWKTLWDRARSLRDIIEIRYSQEENN